MTVWCRFYAWHRCWSPFCILLHRTSFQALRCFATVSCLSLCRSRPSRQTSISCHPLHRPMRCPDCLLALFCGRWALPIQVILPTLQANDTVAVGSTLTLIVKLVLSGDEIQ